MQSLRQCAFAVGLLAVGYIWGASGFFSPVPAGAQESSGDGLSDQASEQIQSAYTAVDEAADTLEQENRYRSATKGVNPFAVLVGGVDAVADLEQGRGVDPETFAALYAGMAKDEIAQHLDRDADGRLTYKGRVVRMYPISRLKQLYAERLKLSGEGEDSSPSL